MESQRLIVFTRYPTPGRTKTRLVGVLGELGAAALQRRMTEHLVGKLTRRLDAEYVIEIRYADGQRQQMQRWLGASMQYAPQGDGDLGDRMCRALDDAFADRCGRAVIVGTDCPQVTEAHLNAAFDALRTHDVVIGPCTDGGYWLIGANKPASIFADVPWGTDQVLCRTRQHIERQGLSLCELDELSDVDRPADLASLPDDLDPNRPFLSVVIPALNEAGSIHQAIASARADGVEIIVVDGGSDDDTASMALAAGAQVVRTDPGRARQMNKGASVAQGEVLLFLHADTVLPAEYAPAVFHALADRSVAGGAFRYRTDLHSVLMKCAETSVNLRSRYLKLPFGDQAIFARRSAFESLGGFPDLAIAEDLYFVQRLKRLGQIVLLDLSVVTSGRRWQELGVIRTTVINHLILAGCRLGVSNDALGRLYRRGFDRGKHKSG